MGNLYYSIINIKCYKTVRVIYKVNDGKYWFNVLYSIDCILCAYKFYMYFA